jgi:penicillin amidase/acyl-homoserine-lactone acylase
MARGRKADVKILGWAGLALLAGALGAAAWLWTPAGPRFDAAAARTAAQGYEARILRDQFGAPHIYGVRNVDVSFGLAYAHAEDDWATIEESVRQNRGTLAALKGGQDSAISDYLMRALGNIDAVDAKYDTITAPARAIAEAYAAGINLWCTDHPESDCARTAPVSGRDVVKGFSNRSPFFYGLDAELRGILDPPEDSPQRAAATEGASPWALLRGAASDIELGSNAIAVAPSRSADKHTRLAINSHQPFTGPVAWYEARLKSEEGIDAIGGVFPGTPLLLVGAGPRFAWAATVNHPDLSDVFVLTVDNAKKPTRYRMDGAWKPLTRSPIRFRVKLWGPFSLPVTRDGYRSEHGPAFVTPRGVFALSYAGDGEVRHLEQYLAMNMARSVADWRAAQINIAALPSINTVAADSAGNIGYFWNAAMPKRAEGFDRTKVLPGDVPATLWQGRESIERLPFVLNPRSGYVVSNNHSPLLPSAPADNPKAEDFPASFGLDTLVTNRSLRAQTLYGGDASITREEFIGYRADYRYDERANVRAMIPELIAIGDGGDADIKAALALLASWDGAADQKNRAAALAIFTGQTAMGGQIHDATTPERKMEALKSVAARLKSVFGRIDPEWGEVSRLVRGDHSWPLDGGPDTLRAVYGNPRDLETSRHVKAVAGDTWIAIVDWAPDGAVRIDTIHQFGAASLDASSPHYADQAPLYARGEYRTPPMSLDALLAEKTSDKIVGRR